MSIEKESEKIYLGYLDKEMTIAGILSTFCIASLLVTINSFILPGKDGQTNIFWKESPWFCGLGLTGFLGAALSFYRQRSLLAYYYGQISLNMVRKKNEEVEDLLDESDSWATWNFYKTGFGFLSISFTEFAFVLINSRIHLTGNFQPCIALTIVFIFFIIFGLFIFVYSKFPYAVYPFKLLRDKKARNKYFEEFGR
jgi:hypothetical protein